MKIQELHIQNYKSLVDLKIVEPNPFTVFAGSNGAGKSNIFESIEFITTLNSIGYNNNNKLLGLFGGLSNIYSYKNLSVDPIFFNIDLGDGLPHGIEIRLHDLDGELLIKDTKPNFIGNHRLGDLFNNNNLEASVRSQWIQALTNASFEQFFNQFTRLFIGKDFLVRQNFIDDFKLNANCSNLEKVLSRILKNTEKKNEIISLLDLLVPGFYNIEIVSEQLSGTYSLVVYEKGTNKPFTKNLLSDGTWNILALITAVYQSDQPQFLCIEEPENGLNPKVQKELVNLFRQKCEEEGHYIWLNTHSQSIVEQLEPKELILVDKVDGETKVKQLKDFDLHGLRMDEAWLTNALGGGLPW